MESQAESSLGNFSWLDAAASDQVGTAFTPATSEQNGGEGVSAGGRKSRNWVFTWNNPTKHVEFTTNMKYMVYQLETAPTTGTPHYQGFIQFKHAVSAAAVKKCIHNSAHVEICISPNKAREYAMKEDTRTEGPWEHGTWIAPAQGKRSDLIDACEMVTKHGLKRVAQDMPAVFVRNYRGLQALQAILSGHRNEEPKICVLWGPTGSGKSRTARDMMPQLEDMGVADPDQHWVWDPSLGKWFQGYSGQKYVIFEEFRGQVPFGQLLSLLDRYTCHVESKGGSTHWVATRIVITSPVHPKYWYESLASNDGQYDQLMRRLEANGSKVIELTQLNQQYGAERPQIDGWDE